MTHPSLRFWLWAVLGIGLSLLPPAARSQEPAKDKRPIYFEVTLVEVPIGRLGKAGIDWIELTKDRSSQSGPGNRSVVDADKLPALVQALIDDKIARVLTRPRMATVSGRKASLQIGEAIELQATPETIDEEHILLDYYLKFSEPLPQSERDKRRGIPPGKRTTNSSMGIKLEAGKTTAVAGLTARRADERGRTEEYAFVTLLRADFKPAEEIRTAEELPPRPMLDGRYREVELLQR